MRVPTSPIAYTALYSRVRFLDNRNPDENKQHVIDVLNSFTREEWLSLLILFNQHDDQDRTLEFMYGVLGPIPFKTMDDLEQFVTDPRLLDFSRRDYEAAKALLDKVSKRWILWLGSQS